jgi:hypothetical protein
MTRLLSAFALAALLASSLAAQGSTGELLQQASQFYEHVDIERALPLLRQIVSPNWPFEVTPAERVEAYKYLGACLALIGKRDSAVVYFRAAIERDPFADLDPERFTPAQLKLFAQARRLTFAIAVRPVSSARIDPRTERVSFSIMSTHATTLEVRVRPAGEPPGRVLFSGPSDGPREVSWDGLLADGRLAPPGRYEFTAIGRSTVLARTDSARVFFDLGHEVAPLEDTVPDLGGRDLLPEQASRSAAARGLLGGLGVAGATLVISAGLSNAELHGSMRAGAGVMVGVATISGITAFLVRRQHREIPANLAANARRRAKRAAENDAIRHRNADKLAATILIVTPAAGFGP